MTEKEQINVCLACTQPDCEPTLYPCEWIRLELQARRQRDQQRRQQQKTQPQHAARATA